MVAFSFLDKVYVEYEQVEEVLKWFITITCEGLFPNMATFVVVYRYGYLAMCPWNSLQSMDCFLYFGVHRFAPSSIVLHKTGLGNNILYVVAVMTFLYNSWKDILFWKNRYGLCVLKRDRERNIYKYVCILEKVGKLQLRNK